MEDKINDLEHRVDDLAMQVGELMAEVEAHEKALITLTNTLHVVDAASLLAVYSLIQTNNLKQPTFKSKQDVIDSGCSDAITRMLKTVQVYMNNEAKKNGKDKTEGR